MKPKTKQVPTPKAPARAMYVGVDTDAGVLCFNKGHLAKKNVRGVVAVIPRATAKQAKAIVRTTWQHQGITKGPTIFLLRLVL